jgi:hypothetical protein
MSSELYKSLRLPLVALLGTVIMALTGIPQQADEANPVNVSLPETIGAWTGTSMAYCHTESCLREYDAAASQLPTKCDDCHADLHAVSLAEVRLLPADSRFTRMLYRRGPGESAFVSIVITGLERNSIHRPEWCLPAQGFKIKRTLVDRIVIPEGHLDISSLDVGRDGSQQAQAKFLYWFSSGNGHHTPRHSSRLFWMAVDSLAHGEQHRWAYVSILVRTPDAKSRDKTAKRFAENLCKTIYASDSQ